MNKVNTAELNKNTDTMPLVWAFINYALNRYMPTLTVCFISFYTIGFATWEPYVIVGLMMFSNRFNFNCGYISATCDNEEDITNKN
jgi:hypothetical protein